MDRSREGERRSAAPWISLAVLFLVVLGIAGWVLRPRVAPPPSGQAQIDMAEELLRLGDEAFASWNQARAARDRGLATRERAKALSIYTRALDAYDDALEPCRDADGLLLPEYEGYEEHMQHVAVRLVDLGKG